MIFVKPVVSLVEARKLLGNDAIGMTDDEILNVIDTLNLLAKDALEMARTRLRMKKDAKGLADIVYSEFKRVSDVKP